MTVREHFKRPLIQEERFDIMRKTFGIQLREMDGRQSVIAKKTNHPRYFRG